MHIRKLKHKGKYWRDDEIYGEQMHHFIAALPILPLLPRETSFNDVG